MKLHVEQLEHRDTPAPLVADAFVPGYAERFGFVGQVQDANLTVGLQSLHCLVGFSAGNGPRVVTLDGTTGDVLASFDAFEGSLRTGCVVESVSTPDGDRLLVAPGAGGGPIIRQFDPLTGKEVAPALVLGDPAADRQGVQYLSSSAGAVYGELGAGAGPRLVGLDPETGVQVVSILIGPEKDRSGLYQPVPAGIGADVAPGVAGVLVETAGDPATTHAVGFDGVFYS